MIVTEQEAIKRISERVYENTRSIRQSNLQRRDTVTDVYGLPIYSYGDANSPARFYISVSPDMQYYHRFQFKLDIQPFRSTSGSGVGLATVSVNDTELNIVSGQIDPNPHTHLTTPHTHTVDAGVTAVPAATSGYRLSVEGHDITPYLLAQHGSWITGEGLYPSTDIEVSYDLLEVASVFMDEGKEAEKTEMLKPGFKAIELSANGPFMAIMYLYCKYSHSER